ncbi:hypothetical protein MRB53_018506 [Persea americana]|uniref:Uncharacterized protein n=1 Tax=Persea americana TaxID=3435 RepID=A0ACC2M836_PERAE|nr:hypothetical protein MRB53_018506 [Persea americana]
MVSGRSVRLRWPSGWPPSDRLVAAHPDRMMLHSGKLTSRERLAVRWPPADRASPDRKTRFLNADCKGSASHQVVTQLAAR